MCQFFNAASSGEGWHPGRIAGVDYIYDGYSF